MLTGLVAGPFMGEFGWELMCWQGFVRSVAKKYSHIVVACREGHEHLYKDFADVIVNKIGGKDTDSEQCHDYKYDNWHLEYPRHDWLNPFIRRSRLYHENYFIVDQDFVPLQVALAAEPREGVCLHARGTDKNKTGYRNWPREKWAEVVEYLVGRGLTVYSIGTQGAAWHIGGTIDVRGNNVRETCKILGRSKLLIGPSSGTMHLGSLCQTPHLVWSGPNQPNNSPSGNDIRYERIWNPFSTQAVHIPFQQSSDWNPPTDMVLDYVRKML